MTQGLRAGDTMIYQLRLRGHLDAGWSSWFDGLAIDNEAGGEVTLTGPLPDQAALHGVLTKVRDLGLPLLAVRLLSHPGEREQGGAASKAADSTEG